jgi:hypothetical protein
MKNITDEFSCLIDIFSKIEQRKTMAYIKYSDGYYEHPEELFLFDLWEDCHNLVDQTLSDEISLWDRYIVHDKLDFLLKINELLFDVEFEGRYMFDFYEYPPEGDMENYEKLQEISPFRSLPIEKSVKIDWL